MPSEPSDYQQIEQAINFIQQHQLVQPELQDIAAAIGASPSHCQRLFSRYAGVSPKRFLQYLTLNHAKQLLQESASVMEASLAVGLSGPSRLHDHFVSLEGVTPGAYRQLGENLTISFGSHQTLFGELFIAQTNRGICQLDFCEGTETEAMLAELRQHWPAAQLTADSAATAKTVSQLFSTVSDETRPLSLLVRGTNFQIKVWEALLQLPAGRVSSYSAVAQMIGKPTASRAVANAVASNPVAYLIPCHRVIRASGKLGGYRWGLTRKQALLAWESANHQVVD